MADGVTQWLGRSRISDQTLRLMITPKDGQVIPMPGR